MHHRPIVLAFVCVFLGLGPGACSGTPEADIATLSGGGSPPGGGSAAQGGSSSGGAVEGAGGRASGGFVATTGGTSESAGGQATGGSSNGGTTTSLGGSSASSGGAGSCTPDPNCEPDPPETGDFHADCVARVNQFRQCMCLPPLARKMDAEECASQQAQYDFENDTYHGGIRAAICAPATLNDAAQNECPEYPSVQSTIGLCHQQMFDEGQCDEFEVCGHFLNMMDDRAKSVACGYYETPSGDVWMVQNFYFR